MKILVTGAAGCAGLAICEELVRRGYEVTGLDNLSRPMLFGEAAPDHFAVEAAARVEKVGAHFIGADFRKLYEHGALVPGLTGPLDAIVHAAAQTSHPRSLETPLVDFEINAVGTLGLLELLRTEHRETRFLYISTSKVYGESVERFPIQDEGLRYGYGPWDAPGAEIVHTSERLCGIGESCPLGDQTKMTPFGISKLAADLYAQEYARAYGLRTAVLRPNCITGGAGTLSFQQQNWIPQIVKACREGKTFFLYGHHGKQVRDVLHSRDLARAVALVLEKAPMRGEVYNVGGGAKNAVSMREAIQEVEKRLGAIVHLALRPPRYGDWRIYVTDFAKLRDAVGWTPEVGLAEIFDEACNANAGQGERSSAGSKE